MLSTSVKNVDATEMPGSSGFAPCSEFAMADCSRRMKQIVGRRLTYAELTGKTAEEGS